MTFEEWWDKKDIIEIIAIDKDVAKTAYSAGFAAGLERAAEIEDALDLDCWCEGNGYTEPLIQCQLCIAREKINNAIRAEINK